MIRDRFYNEFDAAADALIAEYGEETTIALIVEDWEAITTATSRTKYLRTVRRWSRTPMHSATRRHLFLLVEAIEALHDPKDVPGFHSLPAVCDRAQLALIEAGKLAGFRSNRRRRNRPHGWRPASRLEWANRAA